MNENFQNTEHVISINDGDWNSLKNFVSESEVENIKNIFEESLKDIKEFDDNDIEYCSQIYISSLLQRRICLGRNNILNLITT